MIGSDIANIVATSLISNVNQVNRSTNISNVSANSLLFESVLSNIGTCNCNNSNTEMLGVVTALNGNGGNLINSVNTLLDSTNNLLDDITNILSSGNVSNNIIVASSDTKMDKAIKLLKEQVGKPYVWGANGPDSFDCSGLTKYIYKEALGIDIPRVSYDQAKFGKSVSKDDLQVGDLVFFDTMNKGRVSHVGIYIGNNEFIHASNKRDGVKQSKLEGYYEKTYKGARRP